VNITVPQTINDCKPHQLAKWVFLSSGELNLETLSNKLDFRVQVVSIFSGIDKATLGNADVNDINTVFAYIIEMLTAYEEDEPKGVQIVNGTVYTFDKDFSHMTAGQMIDLKLIEDIYQDPYEVLSILYIEDGMKYNQVNDKGHVINDSDFRKKTFREEFDGAEFLNVFAFFLRKFEKRKDAILALNMARTMKTMDEIKKELQENLKTQSGSAGQET
jgi:hypothetical protein